MERTIASKALYRLRPLNWVRDSHHLGIHEWTARVLGTGISIRRFEDGTWHYSAPDAKGYRDAADRADAKRKAVAGLLEWIEESFSKVSEAQTA